MVTPGTVGAVDRRNVDDLLASKGSRSVVGSHPALTACVLALLLWLALGTLRAGPFYLGYFNELIGGPAYGYKYLAGPDVDWGQGLKALGDYLHRNGIRTVKLAYFGTDDPHMYGIQYELLRPGEPSRGYVALSASFASGLHGFPTCAQEYAWLRPFVPIANVSGSILLYRIPPSAVLPPPVSLPPVCFERRSPLLIYY
jgi:hypothetical protein